MSGGGEGVDWFSNKFVNAVAGLVLTIVLGVSFVLIERAGAIEEKLGEMSHAVEKVKELDDVKIRLNKLEIKGSAVSHAQLSGLSSQFPSYEGEFVAMDSVDSIEGSITFQPRFSKTAIKIEEDGSVLILVVPQVRRVEGYRGLACLTTWLSVNDKDVANSSIKNCLSETDGEQDTLTTTLQTILPMRKGDVLRVKMRSDPEGKIGIVVLRPEGIPVVPSVITSLLKVSG